MGYLHLGSANFSHKLCEFCIVSVHLVKILLVRRRNKPAAMDGLQIQAVVRLDRNKAHVLGLDRFSDGLIAPKSFLFDFGWITTVEFAVLISRSIACQIRRYR
jgi:hypothetical protein